MRQEPLKLIQLTRVGLVDYSNRQRKMQEIMESPLRRSLREHELLIWWVCFGILITAILLVLWGGR